MVTKEGYRDRIAAGFVPKHVRERVGERELANWATLNGREREGFYGNALTDHRVAHAWENGFINNKLGQGSSTGRGGVLVTAILDAYNKSDEYRAIERARDEARRREPVVCNVCGGTFTDDYLRAGKSVTCYSCAWTKYPESACMLGIPMPPCEACQAEVGQGQAEEGEAARAELVVLPAGGDVALLLCPNHAAATDAEEVIVLPR